MRIALIIDSAISCAVGGQENANSATGAAEAAGQHPALRSLLANLNDTGSPFSTLGCTVSSAQEDSDPPGFFFASSVGIVFRRDADNSAMKSFIGVAHRLVELLHQDGDSLSLEMLIARGGNAEERSGYCLQLSLSAKGSTASQAQMRWGLGMARLQQALLFIARELTRE